MSTVQKSIIFLALAFAISWSIAIGGHFSGLKEAMGPTGPILLLTAMMAGPAISALICAMAFEKGRRVAALGLRFKLNWWWLLAWLIPLALAAGSVLFTVLLSDRSYIDIGEAARQSAEAAGQDLSQVPPVLMSSAFIIGMSITVGALINTFILTFTEELGWRGYLHDLWRGAGFWRASLGTGFVWGLWHAPAIYFYGLNYPDNAVLGIGLFTVFCMLLSPVMTLVRDRAGSVWAAGIFHGAFNAVGGLTLGSLTEPVFPWNGIVGIGGFIALSIAVAVTALLVQRTPKIALQSAT